MSTDYDPMTEYDPFRPPPASAPDEPPEPSEYDPAPEPGDYTPADEFDPDLAGADELSPQLAEFVQAAVTKRIRKEADAIAAAKFEEMLTPDLHQQLQAAATRQLEAQTATALAEPEQVTEPDEPQLVFGSVEEFVREKLTATYMREVADVPHRNWCPEWWRHTEAISRLEALWRSWEHLRLDPRTGMSVWWRDHADHHMEKLFSSDGPFKHCDVRQGHKDMLKPLPSTPAPPAMFPDTRTH
ncbi:MAG: DUF4913 domain-containing protein [Rhodococcus sp. (in: high G+C Gram-positive bacteria)]|uniref:DUF4913 domain-containing protein n=1 Tax=Rhodococcus sp. TaxID=1831 RepID=UPI003BB1583D